MSEWKNEKDGLSASRMREQILGRFGLDVGLDITTAAEIPESRRGFDWQGAGGEWVMRGICPEIGLGKAKG